MRLIIYIPALPSPLGRLQPNTLLAELNVTIAEHHVVTEIVSRLRRQFG
jgi:hypothetical protein